MQMHLDNSIIPLIRRYDLKTESSINILLHFHCAQQQVDRGYGLQVLHPWGMVSSVLTNIPEMHKGIYLSCFVVPEVAILDYKVPLSPTSSDSGVLLKQVAVNGLCCHFALRGTCIHRRKLHATERAVNKRWWKGSWKGTRDVTKLAREVPFANIVCTATLGVVRLHKLCASNIVVISGWIKWLQCHTLHTSCMYWDTLLMYGPISLNSSWPFIEFMSEWVNNRERECAMNATQRILDESRSSLHM